MANDDRRPNINARRLGLYLRRTREYVGLSYEEAAARTGCDAEWLVRVETGFENPSPAQVERILERYQVREAKVAELMIDLAARPQGPDWLAAHSAGMKAATRDALISESESSVIHTYGIQLVPDLAQAEPYARLMASVQIPRDDADGQWRLLDHRQRYRPGGRRRFLDVIVDEGALTLPLDDPQIMPAQLRHLLELGAGPDASIRVVPSKARFYEDRANPFDVLEFPGISDRISLVHTILGIDFAYGDLTGIWKHIEEESALSPDDSRDLIQRLIAG